MGSSQIPGLAEKPLHEARREPVLVQILEFEPGQFTLGIFKDSITLERSFLVTIIIINLQSTYVLPSRRVASVA